MRPDQLEQLNDLGEQLMDVFATEADPRNWPGANMPAADMPPDQRGNRNWTIKNANQIGALLARTLDLKERLQGLRGGPAMPEDDADREIARAEKLARDTLTRIGKAIT